MRRRRYLIGAVAGAAALGGCTGTTLRGGEATDTPHSTPPEWTRSTDCDDMQDSIVKIVWVVDDLSDNYAPVPYAELTTGEREIIDTALAEGGYGTCEVTDAFTRFVQRVADHRDKQQRNLVHLEHNGRYYGLYVEKQDQVFSSK